MYKLHVFLVHQDAQFVLQVLMTYHSNVLLVKKDFKKIQTLEIAKKLVSVINMLHLIQMEIRAVNV